MSLDLAQRLEELAEHAAAARARLAALRDRLVTLRAMILAIRTTVVPNQPLDDTPASRYTQARSPTGSEAKAG
jgi:hypothetical protein